MIGFDDALEKAKRLKPNIDKCTEYDNAYVFTYEGDMNTIGGDGACVILKDGGRAISQIEFYENHCESEPEKEIEL